MLSASNVDYKLFTMPGGEPHVQINRITERHIVITCIATSFNDIGELLVLNDALRRHPLYLKITLNMPYFPGARQDRAPEGEALTVKVYADLINSAKFDRVIITDPHSDVTPALLNNCEVRTNDSYIQTVINNLDENVLFIAPDAGATKKVERISRMLNIPYIQCTKKRDIKTGALSSYEVHSDDLMGCSCVVVDDICDGGGTFLLLADQLKAKNSGNLYLIVTHGIFSKGKEELLKKYSLIFTPYDFGKYPEKIESSERVITN